MAKWHNEWARKEIEEFGLLFSEDNCQDVKIFGIKYCYWCDYHWSLDELDLEFTFFRVIRYYLWDLTQKLQGRVWE